MLTAAAAGWTDGRRCAPAVWSTGQTERGNQHGVPDYSPLCCKSLATRPVQPVWWLAPTPEPSSPWKYS